jgi:outer membrane lipoprotein LolB
MIFARAVLSLCAIGVLSLLGACASLAPQEVVPRAAPFDVLGRALVGYDGKSLSASVRWQHGVDYDELWLMTPTGQTLAHLREDGSGATITGTDQTKYHGTRVESLTQQALGWEFPLARLQHWVRGAPSPNSVADIAERDGNGRITRMTQDGWRIGYEYTAAPEYDGLPRRVDVTRTAQNIRLVIDSWRRDSQANESSPSISITR